MFRRRVGCPLNVLCKLNLRPLCLRGNKVKSLEIQITNNHSKFLKKLGATNKTAKEGLQVEKNHEIVINALKHKNQVLK